MVIRVGINGFGRIGRISFRTCFHNSEIQLTAINDPAIDIEYICYLIKFDSTHGKFRGTVTHTDDEITINDQKIKVFQEKFPPDVPWDSAGVQYVIEASGMFTSLEKASGHLASEGVRRVIVTAPSVDVPMVILGVNDYMVDTGQKVISCASSTLYCLAPIIKVLNDQYGVVEGFITSIHAMTPSLKPLDGLCLRGKHWRDHRSINQNIIPATTGACKALGKILPQVKDKLTGLAFRVPIINVSVLDITIKLDTSTSLEDIVKSVENASKRQLRHIIRTSKENAVSSDFIGDSHSCILDVDSSLQLRPTFYKLICWYENEYSYACRVVDSIFYSEMQLAQSKTLTTKTTYVRAKIPKQLMLPKPDSNKQLTIQCNYVTTARDQIYCTNSNESIITKNATNARPSLYRKPLLSQNSSPGNTTINHDTEQRNEIFKVWNDDCDAANNAIRQNRNSFFHSCMTFSPKDPLQQTNSIKERLERVQRDFSKMLVITEDLLNQSYSSKMKLQCLGTQEVMTVNSNVELKLESTFNSCTEEAQDIEKRSEINNLIYQNCGDFNKGIVRHCNVDNTNNKTNVCECVRTETMNNCISVEDSEIGYDAIINLHKDEICSGNSRIDEYSIEGKLNVLTNESNLDISYQEHPSTVNHEINSQVVKTIKSLTYVITNEVVENVFSELNLSVPLIATNSFQDNELHNNVLSFDDGVQDRISEQNLEDKQLMNKGRSDNFYLKNLQKYLSSKRYDMHLIDEELRRRNIILTNNDSNDVLNITNENSIVDDRRKNFDLNKRILAGLRMVTEADVTEGISQCASPAYTATTVSNYEKNRVKQDLYDKLDSASASDSDNSFQINARKSQVLSITDLTNSLEDLERLDKICRIIEISDELSDQLFSKLDNNNPSNNQKKKWSLKDLCERIKLDEFYNNMFGTSSS